MTLLGTTQMPGTSTSLSDLVTSSRSTSSGGPSNSTNTDGRQHNPNHQVSFAIGKPFKGGVYGGLQLGAAEASDFGALPIDSATGAGAAAGDIKPVDTLAAFAMTVATGVGIPATVVQSSISSDSQYMPMGGGTAKIVDAALA